MVLAVVLVLALAVGNRHDGGPRTNAERVADLSAELRCPTCRGQSVLESDAPAAAAIRTEIARRIDEGQGEEEIKAYLVDRFTPSILLTPPRSGVAALVWVLPVAGLVVAVAALTVAFRRWHSQTAATVDDDDRMRVALALRSRR